MTTFGNFSSLLQLGVGIGIGLSLFRAPVDLRVSKLDRAIEAELAALRGVTLAFATLKRRDLLDLKLHFRSTKENLEVDMLPFMALAVIGSALNLVGLVFASIYPAYVLNNYELYAIIFVSIVLFALDMVFLEAIAQFTINPIKKKLLEIRLRKAPV